MRLCDFLDLVDCDAVRVERIVGYTIPVGPEFVVDEDAAADEAATGMPVWKRPYQCPDILIADI